MKIGFLILSFLLMLCVLPASALTLNDDYSTSGTVEYQIAESNSYTIGASNQYIEPFNHSRLYHDFTYSKEVTRAIIYSKYASDSGEPIYESEWFDAYVNGEYYGRGIIALKSNANLGYVDLDVDFTSINDDVAYSLTGDNIIYLDYDDSTMYDNVSYILGGTSDLYVLGNKYTVPTDSNPTLFTSDAEYSGHPFAVSGNIISSYMTIYENDYIYDYNSSVGYANLIVEKGTSGSKWLVYDSTDTFVNQDTYTENSIDTYFYPSSSVYATVTFNVDGGHNETEILHILESSNGSSSSSSEEDITVNPTSAGLGDTISINYTTTKADRIYIKPEGIPTITETIVIDAANKDGIEHTWEYTFIDDSVFTIGSYLIVLYDNSEGVLDQVEFSYLGNSSESYLLNVELTTAAIGNDVPVYYKASSNAYLVIENPNSATIYNQSVNTGSSVGTYSFSPSMSGEYTFSLVTGSGTLTDTLTAYDGYTDPIFDDDPDDDDDDSSYSSTSDSIIDSTSHEWTNEEIATSSRKIVPPIFFIVLLVFFLYVIGGN